MTQVAVTIASSSGSNRYFVHSFLLNKRSVVWLKRSNVLLSYDFVVRLQKYVFSTKKVNNRIESCTTCAQHSTWNLFLENPYIEPERASRISRVTEGTIHGGCHWKFVYRSSIQKPLSYSWKFHVSLVDLGKRFSQVFLRRKLQLLYSTGEIFWQLGVYFKEKLLLYGEDDKAEEE